MVLLSHGQRPEGGKGSLIHSEAKHIAEDLAVVTLGIYIGRILGTGGPALCCSQREGSWPASTLGRSQYNFPCVPAPYTPIRMWIAGVIGRTLYITRAVDCGIQLYSDG